jgi:hypothetical protein
MGGGTVSGIKGLSTQTVKPSTTAKETDFHLGQIGSMSPRGDNDIISLALQDSDYVVRKQYFLLIHSEATSGSGYGEEFG